MQKMLLIFLGSGIGGVLRFALSGWAQRLSGAAFPIGTLAVNVIGCLLIGWIGAALTGRLLMREEYRLAIIVGLLGSFTTFSAFGWETFTMISDGQYARAAANAGLSVILSVAAVMAGYRIAALWPGL